MTANLPNHTRTQTSSWLSKESRYALLIAAACAYLSLFNLGYAPLWVDEPHMASVARNLLDSGKFTTWDGRNLIGADNGRAVNQDLVAVSSPPWRAISTLVGIKLFGYNETGVRFFHALLGVASLFVFWHLLRLDFASRPRLRVIAFALFALSAQSILFFRQGRYTGDAIFFSLAVMYAYRLYIGAGGKAWHLACAVAFAVLNFFNHFFIGITTLMAIAVWHLMFHWRATTRKQWVSFVIAGTVFSAVCLGYLWVTGIIENREKLDLGDRVYQLPWTLSGSILTFVHFRDMVRFNWVPMWIAVWLLCWLGWIALARPKTAKKEDARHTGWRSSLPTPDPQDVALARYFALFALLLIFTAFITIQSPTQHFFATTRYLVAALPLAFVLSAGCVDWIWRRFGSLVAVMLLATLMVSNLVGQPTSFRELRLTLPSLIQEIHRPLRNSTVEVTEYLETNAKQDDLIRVEPWIHRDVLVFYLGDMLRFCCQIDEDTTPLPPETVSLMGEHLYQGKLKPDWIAVLSKEQVVDLSRNPEYELVFTSEASGYPSSHRPELEQHYFFGHSGKHYVHAKIYKRNTSAGDQPQP